MAGMEFIVRQMGTSDRLIWAEMRTALWPDETLLAHDKTVDELLGDRDLMTQPSALQRLPSGNTPTAAILGLSPFSKAFGSNRSSDGEELGRG